MDPRHRLALTDTSDDRPGPWQPAPSVAANKVARFTGTTRKSKFELEREAEQQRDKAARDDAARAYDEFVEAFGGDDEVGPSRGGARARVGGAGAGRSKGKGFVRAGGVEKYDPLAGRPPQPEQAAPAPAPAAPTPSASRAALQPQAAAFVPKNQPRATAASLMADEDESQAQAPVVSVRKKRAGDTFLEQLKRDQAAREERLKQTAGRVGSSITALAAREHAPVLTGSYDVGDPLTTNLHVGGLPTNVTEQSFGKLFAQFGPVGSVKIMWPRLDSGHLAAMGGRKLGGFVAFLRRPDAERAAKEMDGAEWGDNTLKIGWGKAVPIPATAIYEPDYDARSSHRARSRSLSPDLDPHEFLRAKAAGGPSSASKRARSHSRSPPRTRAWPQLEEGVDEPFLVAVAKRVRDNGRQFEEVLKDKERDNARFDFLRDDKLPSYHYFRMLVDPSYEPPLVASFDDEGKASIYSSDSSEYSDDDRVGKGHLSPLAERRFTSLLRGLTSSRDKIARGMSFALEHADSADYIADLLVCSLTIDSTPVPRKLARLHLVSDILHNSAASVPNAWTYRSIFERKLPAVFDHLGDIYLSFPGRLKAEQFRGLIEKVLDVWANDWIVFEPSVIDDFKRRLAGLDVLPPSSALEPSTDSAPSADVDMHGESAVAPSQAPAQAPVAADALAEPSSRAFKPSFKAASFAPAAPEPESEVDADVDGAPVELGGGGGEDDVDGAPVELELDGAPLDLDGDEVDGAPIALDDDVDGAPVAAAAEEDVDGAPLPVGRETETVVLDGEGEEAMDMGSEDDIFQ
ncbi:uncharacterized protein RHOBADRAFT_56422 [Rhodotorula graminis WP1]|uniref:RRM domain-containing protein n=1 Tax=Rhodotorula graminis (strain WP1) TaxID=578459 RepID=A0A0P9GWK0_RHOGW|nr:uncharacterized protein RHOBADRAFT_56422 [Rhodotorula graminis WP1]KPV71807.1 hypothetical protein RHOBADRAFT_56422 [Rhodotorula graminis WP1]